MAGKMFSYYLSGRRLNVKRRVGLYPILRTLLFRCPPEVAHSITLAMMHVVGIVPPVCWCVRQVFQPSKNDRPVQVFGLTFPNSIGLAAGYDKDGLGWRGLAALGFGHIEVGTVTPKPQSGNPRPRVFRLIEDVAVVNRMGFPNRGADFMERRLHGDRPPGLILGVNIGKNLSTSLEHAAQDYVYLVKRFAAQADYLTVNVSSPNTPDLRRLQIGGMLGDLLKPIDHARKIKEAEIGRRIPVLVKLAPDLQSNELDSALQAILDNHMDGVVISNTSTARYNLKSLQVGEIGGLSGKPIMRLSTSMVRRIVKRTSGKLPVVASGGVMNPYDAKAKLDAGASLVQIYTGLIYAGPGLVKNIRTFLA